MLLCAGREVADGAAVGPVSRRPFLLFKELSEDMTKGERSLETQTTLRDLRWCLVCAWCALLGSICSVCDRDLRG